MADRDSSARILAALDRIHSAGGPELRHTETLSDIPERATAVVADGQTRLVLKIDGDARSHQREVWALGRARCGKVPVPGLIYADRGPPGILLMEYIGGTQIASDRGAAKRGGRASAVAAWSSAGNVLRKLHDLIDESSPRFEYCGQSWSEFVELVIEGDLAWLTTSDLVPGQVISGIRGATLDLLDDMDEPGRVLLHGDAHEEHWILDDPATGIRALIDLAECGSGDPLWDIATLTLWVPSLMDTVLEGYQADERFRRRAERYLPLYRVMRLLSATRWSVEHNFDCEDYVVALQEAVRSSGAAVDSGINH